jgi:hypothetical protein
MRTLSLHGVGVLAACCVMFPGASAAQQSGPQGDTYASIAKLPEWGGAWVIPFHVFVRENGAQRDPQNPLAPRLTPERIAMQAATRRGLNQPGNGNATTATITGNDSLPRRRLNAESCLPTGMPNVMRYAFAVEFLFTPGRVTMLLEQDTTIRRIYTDGRAHAEDPEVSYAGESIGHWEGDTLVVHTTAISPRAELLAGVTTSGKATVTERIRLIETDHLQIDTTVEDPVALLAPWRYSRIYERSSTGFFERICADNNRELNGDTPDLTPPIE